eukprot:3808596-Rhodomonas_salina.1
MKLCEGLQPCETQTVILYFAVTAKHYCNTSDRGKGNCKTKIYSTVHRPQLSGRRATRRPRMMSVLGIA